MKSYIVRGRFVVVGITACALLALASSAGAASVRGLTRGSWTLSKDVIFPLEKKIERRSVPYVLPRHARQGPSRWYLMHLHFRITFPKRNEPGFVFVSGLTNRRAAALVEFHVLKAAHGVSKIRWSTVNYINGKMEGTTSGRSIEIHYTNYLQYRGVRPGRNVFTVQLERYTATRAASLRVFDDSGVSSTPLSPAHLIFAVDDDVKTVRVGGDFSVHYTLRNTGDRPGQKVQVTPEFRRGTMEQVGSGAKQLKLLRGTVHGTLRFRALRTGVFPLGLFVSSGSNKPGQLVEIRVSPRPSRFHDVLGLLPRGIGGLLLVGGLALVGLRRRRPGDGAGCGGAGGSAP
jgi:hypothetical protein